MNFNELIDKYNSGILTESDITEFEISQYLEDWSKPKFKHKEPDNEPKSKKDTKLRHSKKTIKRDYSKRV